jgi:hypothetical protein
MNVDGDQDRNCLYLEALTSGTSLDKIDLHEISATSYSSEHRSIWVFMSQYPGQHPGKRPCGDPFMFGAQIGEWDILMEKFEARGDLRKTLNSAHLQLSETPSSLKSWEIISVGNSPRALSMDLYIMIKHNGISYERHPRKLCVEIPFLQVLLMGLLIRLNPERCLRTYLSHSPDSTPPGESALP